MADKFSLPLIKGRYLGCLSVSRSGDLSVLAPGCFAWRTEDPAKYTHDAVPMIVTLEHRINNLGILARFGHSPVSACEIHVA